MRLSQSTHTSSMPNDDFNSAYQDEVKSVITDRSKVAIYFLATPLVLIFTFVDLYHVPDLHNKFLLIRCSIIATCLVCYTLFQSKIIKDRLYYIPSFIMTLHLGIYNAILITYLGYEESHYYMGLNLVSICVLAFFPYNFLQMTVSLSTIYIPYILIILTKNSGIIFSDVLLNLSFSGSFVIIGLVANKFFDVERKKVLKFKLQKEANERLLKEYAVYQNKVIDKTSKKVRLNNMLAENCQEEVAEKLRTDKDFKNTKENKEIGMLFLDIKSSSQKAVTIGNDSFAEILDMFMENAIKVCKEHNLIIGGFLGDGLFAISNAPSNQSHYKETILSCALDILNIREKAGGYFNRVWKGDLIVRIGIHSGPANIGFHPSFENGAYTAVGKEVNLASRLCELANDNSIAMTKDMYLSIQNKKLITTETFSDHNKIKGFDGQVITVAQLKPRHGSKTNTKRLQCAKCSSTDLLIDIIDSGQLLLYKCKKCEYNDIFEANSTSIDLHKSVS